MLGGPTIFSAAGGCDKMERGLPTLPTLAATTPRSSPRKPFLAVHAQHNASTAPLFSDTTVWCAVTLVLCVLVFVTYTGAHNGINGTQGATVLGKRSWKDMDLTLSQRLELQLESKQEEVDTLKLKISRVLASSRMAESNMASQESLIRTLQSRQEAEKSAKYKALYALAEHTKLVDECVRTQRQMEMELVSCQEDLSAVSS